MGYTKLFSEIITSTIWAESDETRIVWITMLALKDKWGVVNATVPGLAHLARVPVPVCEKAIGKFLAPDKYSRTNDFEGRRIEVVDGGWRVLNHEKYRRLMSADERREYLAMKQREHRARKQSVNSCQQESTQSTHSDRQIADSEANAVKTEREGAKAPRSRPEIPTLEQWLAEAKGKHPGWPERDATGAWEHYEAIGWKVGKNPVEKWRMCIGTCYRNFIDRGGVPDAPKLATAHIPGTPRPFTPLPPMIPFDKLMP